MLKKMLSYIMIISFLMSFPLKEIFAYDYVDESNGQNVEEMLEEVYDRKEQYVDLAGEDNEGDEEIAIEEVSSDYYWWPIGSKETQSNNGKEFASNDPETVSITSPFGERQDPFKSDKDGDGEIDKVFHSGLDIGGGSGLGSVNIIAAKDGTVVYSSKGGTVCSSGSQQSLCGGGYGNYIIIQHTDGNYTLYAHLYENSLTVSEGESVKQGQVIAKMGSSGNSTGAHLHFEVREGQNAYSATVDPLNYIDPDKPRPVNASKQLVKYIEDFEGHTDIIGDSYLVVNIGDGVRTVGAGVVLDFHAQRFKARGLDVTNYPVGSTIPITIVDSVEAEIIGEMKSSVESKLSQNNITLKPYQVDALVSFYYNIGNIEEFPSAYEKYGDTDELYNNFFGRYVHVGDEVWSGLVRRRKAEWHLFHTGEYTQGWELK